MFLLSDKPKRIESYEKNMRSCAVQKKENKQERLFQQIVNGNYPSRDVSKMNDNSLESFVLRLLKFTSIRVGAKTKSDPELTNWWPWASGVQAPKSDRKEFRGNLKKVVIDCCDFFKGYNQKWLPQTLSWINDENFDFIQAKAEKRKAKDSSEIPPPTKKRKTLLFTIKKETKSEPCISISRYIPEPDLPSKPLDQAEFLQIFKLSLNNNEIPKATQVPNSSRIIRLQNCPHVPFSSNIGQVLMKKENCNVPDNVTERRLERIEWYINKESPKTVPDLKFEVTYVQSKNYTEHNFRFPIKQYHQIQGDTHFNAFIRKICKPLTVVVKNENLVELKKRYDELNVLVKVNKLSKRQIKKYICKDAKVVIQKQKSVSKIIQTSKSRKVVKKINLKNVKRKKATS